MTENEIKEMLKDIIDNGTEYECRHICGECDDKRENCDDTCTMTDRLWNKYHLGEEHEKKTWLDETFPLGDIVDDLHMEGEKERLGVTEVCKKILKEFEDKLPFYIDTGRNHLLKDIKSIIEDLGVEV